MNKFNLRNALHFPCSWCGTCALETPYGPIFAVQVKGPQKLQFSPRNYEMSYTLQSIAESGFDTRQGGAIFSSPPCLLPKRYRAHFSGGYRSKDITLTIHVHLEFPPMFALKPYGGVEVRPYAFLSSTVDGGN